MKYTGNVSVTWVRTETPGATLRDLLSVPTLLAGPQPRKGGGAGFRA